MTDRLTEVVIHDREREFTHEFPPELGVVELLLTGLFTTPRYFTLMVVVTD